MYTHPPLININTSHAHPDERVNHSRRNISDQLRDVCLGRNVACTRAVDTTSDVFCICIYRSRYIVFVRLFPNFQIKNLRLFSRNCYAAICGYRAIHSRAARTNFSVLRVLTLSGSALSIYVTYIASSSAENRAVQNFKDTGNLAK